MYSHSVYYKWARDLPGCVTQQLREGNRLWNDLVEAHLAYESRVAKIWNEYPDVASAGAAVADAQERYEAAAAALAQARSVQRTKRVKGPAAEQVKATRESLAEARRGLREAKQAALAQAGPAFLDAAAVRDERVRELKTIYCKQGALYYRNYDDIVGSWRTSVTRLKKQRAEAAATPGSPYPQLRFHRFDGTGRCMVVLLRRAGDAPRTPAVIADAEGGRYRNVLAIPGWVDPAEWGELPRAERRRRGHVVARLRVGGAGGQGGGEVIEVPVQVSRMLPANADIAEARLVVKRVGTRAVVTLNVTAKLPSPIKPVGHNRPVVALHLGWRTEEDGLRVATWRSSAPLEVPDSLAHVVTASGDGMGGTVVLPPELEERLERLARRDGDRALRFGAARDALASWLAKHGPVDHPTRTDPESGAPEQLTSAAVTRWRSPARLAGLALAWQPDGAAPAAPGSAELAATLEEWRRADKQAWNGIAGGRRRVTAARGRGVRRRRGLARGRVRPGGHRRHDDHTGRAATPSR